MTQADHPPRKLPRQARSRALVEAILDGAAHILARHGREALTTNAVAERAGVSIGSLYQYFPNREAVIAAVAERHGHRLHHRVADLDLSGEISLEGALTRIAGALFAAHRIDPALHAALDGALGHHNHHHHHDTGHAGGLGTKQAMAMQIVRLPAPARAEIGRPDLALAAAIAAEIVHALAHAAIVHPHGAVHPETIEREAVHAAVAYLRGGKGNNCEQLLACDANEASFTAA